jgi:phospholipid transport system substrate-binding protein
MLMIALAFLFGLAGSAFAQRSPEAPDDLIRRVSREVMEIARSDEAIQSGNQQRILMLVRQRVLPHIDFERMTALAAGRYWRQATPVQQQRLTEEFRDLLVHVYSGAIAQVKDKQLVVKPMRGDPGRGEVEVRSEVIQKNGAEPIELNYRLAREDTGWKIYDVSVLDVWLVQSYRGTFASEIGRRGIDGLIETLDARNARLAARGGSAGGAPASGS